MMMSAIGREFSRQLSEYKQFKLNLLFANLGIFFLVTGFLNYFDSGQDAFELFILLFTWYFSSHSITYPTYFIEDEIADRTIINVIQSRRSIFGMLSIKIIVQILLDLVKALPLFCLIALVHQIDFPTDWGKIVADFFLSFVAIVSLYGLGFLFASFSFIFTQISSITSLLAYGILFLVGFQSQSSRLFTILSYGLPFHLLRAFIRHSSWALVLFLVGYGLLYWFLGWICFHTCLTYAKKKGSLFHV